MKLICLLTFLLFLTFNIHAQNERIFYASRYGLIGDGITDNYDAFLKLVHDVNLNNGGKIILEKGVYVIRKYKDGNNKLSDLSYIRCQNLTIEGNNSTVKLTNQFKKIRDKKRGKATISEISSIIPFSFSNVNFLQISNLIVDGGNDNAEKEIGISEKPEHLFSFSDCSNVTVNKVTAQNSLCDGFYIKKNNKNFTFKDVKSLNNARQGLSIIGLKDAKFENCEFSRSGYSKYGFHPPAAGLDIEPNAPNSVNNIVFTACQFQDNRNAQVIITRPTFTANVLIENSNIDATRSTYPYQIILSGKYIRLLGNKINLNSGSIYPAWSNFENSIVELKNNRITSSGRGIVVTGAKSCNVLIEGNYLKFNGNQMKSYFPYIRYPLIFNSNTVEVPHNYLNKKYISLIENVKQFSKNKFVTDKGVSFKSKVSFSQTIK
ncbi:right-handed parallel beta-helix repeat-containing protein [Sphingobacterium siyangense]|uniref:right-handed parallel beta-helix repeat-containing protein n=1 Tax=Sphingobacterium siyangense TaxID=459529 RepID=UPI003DA6AA19